MITNNLVAQDVTIEHYNQNQLNSTTANRSTAILSQENYYLETDKVSLSYSSESLLTYSSSMTVQGAEGDGFDLLRGLVLNIFKDQGIEYRIPTGESEIDLSEISSGEAQALIADEGYFGVEQTSNRIVDFAIGLSGDDPSRLEAIKQGVENGFQEALDAFGGWLPEISYETYNTVVEKLDIWAGVNHSSEA